MIFTRLRLMGFKSFTDPVELVFEPGLTGVVGPNGCGKSNLVEALRWVMGESSYKAMRGAGMDDVIFAGSANRPARNAAEVTVGLDNTDRTAPAAFNTTDTIEVSRRIEREHGSVYRINGREARARDVQLLFADASTGAHSPALVRQGQIGELIAAKPTQRRALLEEAAGISGLHSRRREAELRLRAAEQNLERVDDIVAQVETQLEALRRQARQAHRYRALSSDIRRTEAALHHLRWVAARYAEKETEAEQGRLIARLADTTHADHEARKGLEAAEAGLAPLRQADVAAAAGLQRLAIALEQLEADRRRADQRRAELADRLRQIETDTARETALVAESEETIAGLDAERAGIEAANAQAEGDIAAARSGAEAARQALDEGEARARAAGEALAGLRAARAQAERAVEDGAKRVERLAQKLDELDRDAAAIAQSLAADETVAGRRAALDAAQGAAQAAEAAAEAGEAAAREAEGTLEAARPALVAAEAALNRLEAEAETLSRVLNLSGASLWPAIVDTLAVEPGYEIALGAALGEDLDASADSGAPIHWQETGPASDPSLPDGVQPLSDRVSGAPLLARRLRQIGLVTQEEGARLAPRLAPGQRLVTRAGALWRWDGLVAAADAPTPAAQRLAQRNRLAEIDAEIVRLKAERAQARARVETLKSELEAVRRLGLERRGEAREAQRALLAARAGLEAAEKSQAGLLARQTALAESRARLDLELAEARDAEAVAAATLAELGDTEAARREAEALQQALAGLRAAAEDARLRLSGHENAAAMRANRLEGIGREHGSWTRRRADARAQLDILSGRHGALRAELGQIDTAPDAFSSRRAALEAEIETARETRRQAGDRLSAAETQHREADRAARAAAEALGSARADLARVEERLKGQIAQRRQIEQQIFESLDIPAARTAEAAGIRPEDPLPQQAATEARLDRLKAERERLGGVNLRAEEEAAEIAEKRDRMVADREDLVAAIAKLRTGIMSLNREGRARLTEAFAKVNAHFTELFTTLFGGGTAELTFVESEDPLEAGLEIIARPPGKKPQTMTLLSGGEQALTAMSLIFAVFLTNPAPICVLDEVDAPLDDANVERFCDLLDWMRGRTDTRFLVITHNPITMSRMDRLFGVTMPERGVSQLVSVDLATAETFREAV